MKPSARIALACSGLLMTAFVINVVLSRDGAAMMGTVTEALVLLAAAACFSIATLICESAAPPDAEGQDTSQA